jgi:hypothetical protein
MIRLEAPEIFAQNIGLMAQKNAINPLLKTLRLKK